jgi:hypothetical protein
MKEGQGENVICKCLHKVLSEFLDNEFHSKTYFYQRLDAKTIKFFLPATEKDSNSLVDFLHETCGMGERLEEEEQ